MQLDLALYKTDIARKLAEIVNILIWTLSRALAFKRVDPLIDRAVLILFRSAKRLESLTQRWKTGKLRTRKPRQRAPRDPAKPAPPRAHTRKSWLPALVPPAMSVADLLTALMEAPETRALIEAAPQAGRIFRPICRMFGIAVPDHLKLPARAPRAPRAPRIREKPSLPAKPREADPDHHYRFTQVPRKWRLKPPRLRFSSA